MGERVDRSVGNVMQTAFTVGINAVAMTAEALSMIRRRWPARESRVVKPLNTEYLRAPDRPDSTEAAVLKLSLDVKDNPMSLRSQERTARILQILRRHDLLACRLEHDRKPLAPQELSDEVGNILRSDFVGVPEPQVDALLKSAPVWRAKYPPLK